MRTSEKMAYNYSAVNYYIYTQLIIFSCLRLYTTSINS